MTTFPKFFFLGSETAKDSSDSQSDSNEPDDSATKPAEKLNVEYTTSENLEITSKEKFNVTTTSTESINLDNDEQQPNSNNASDEEEDEENSVFESERREVNETAGPSTSDTENPKLTRFSTSENHEEVDDIELIFSSEDKDFPQEDLVSISDYEPWEKTGTSGTPVLVNFSTIPSDQETDRTDQKMDEDDNVENSGEGFYEAVKNESGQRCSIDSNDDSGPSRLSASYFGKSSSLDKSSSSDLKENAHVGRDESFDSFEPVKN